MRLYNARIVSFGFRFRVGVALSSVSVTLPQSSKSRILHSLKPKRKTIKPKSLNLKPQIPHVGRTSSMPVWPRRTWFCQTLFDLGSTSIIQVWSTTTLTIRLGIRIRLINSPVINIIKLIYQLSVLSLQTTYHETATSISTTCVRWLA